MTVRSSSVLIVVFALLTACAVSRPTPYGPMDEGYGYSEEMVSETSFRVSFSGNADTPRQVVQDYVLYRSAELALEQGHDQFVVLNTQTSEVRDDAKRYEDCPPSPYYFPNFSILVDEESGGYVSSALVELSHDAAGERGERAFMAQGVIDTLGSCIQRDGDED